MTSTSTNYYFQVTDSHSDQVVMQSVSTAIHPNSPTDHGEQRAQHTGFMMESPTQATISLEPETNNPPGIAVIINEVPVARRSGRATRTQVATYTDAGGDMDDEHPGSQTGRGLQCKGRARVARSQQPASKLSGRKVNIVIR